MRARAWPHAVLFDLDGTLVHSLPDIAGALNELLQENGYRAFDAAEVRTMVGGGVPKLVERALRALGEPPDAARIAPLVARYLELYAPRAARLTRLFPGARAVLEELRGQAVRLGLCTNKPETIARRMLRELDVSHLFGAIIGGDTTAARKPQPEPVLAALDRLRCRPGESLMVGDSAADAGAARAAGVPVILVSFGYARTPVAEMDADGIVDSFAELPKLLANCQFRAPAS